MRRFSRPGYGFALERRGAVTVMFAMGVIPMVGLMGLAIDFGFWNQAHSEFQVAADAAAVNSVRLAASRYIANDANWQAEAVQNGHEWFGAQVGSYASGRATSYFYNGAVNGLPAVTVSVPPPTNLTFTSTVSYSTATNTFLAKLFNQPQFGMTGTASATITATIYSELVLLMDNSSSMEIGSTNTDIAQIQELVPCDASAGGSGQGYSSGSYTCSGYDGGLACPVVSQSPFPLPGTTYKDPGAGGKAPSCTNLPPVKGSYPTAQAPCAFACHWDTSAQSQQNPITANDYYGAVLRSNKDNGTSITLRFNVVQSAVSTVLQTAQQQDLQNLSNVTAGAYIFSSDVSEVFPTDGQEASTDLAGAANAVAGIPANVVAGAAGNTGNTDFSKSMTDLMTKLSPAGDGSTPQAPRKSLILVTDGMDDATTGGSRYLGPFASSYCSTLKSSPYNYTIYVLYTPYFPLMNGWYQGNVKNYVEPGGASPVSAALQACASSAADYYAATSSSQIQMALSAILKSATRTAVRFTE